MTEILFGERPPVAVRMEAPGDNDQHHHQQRVDLPVQHEAAAVVAQQAGEVGRHARQRKPTPCIKATSRPAAAGWCR